MTEAAAEGRRFFWARHGQAEHNVLIDAGRKAEGRGLLDPPLTEAGREQAAGLAASLAALSLPEQGAEAVADGIQSQVDVVVTSPMTRALETAEIAVGTAEVPVIVTSLHTETGIPQPGDEVAGQNCQKGSSLALQKVGGSS